MTTRPRAAALAAALAAAAACAPAGRTPAPAPPAAPVASAAACTFTNPVMPGADPSVVRRGGAYYMAQSRDGGIVVYRSDRLERLAAARPVRVWAAPDTGWNHANVWAPELLEFDGRWYIYYAASRAPGSPFVGQRTGVLRSRTADPQGAWEDVGPLYTGDGPAGAGGENVWAIDMTVGRINGRLYAVWSGWERAAPTDKTVQHLYISPMRDPVTMEGPRRMLSSPTAPWERGPELPLQEGPEFLARGGQTFLVYSTNDSWLPTYQLGQLRLKPGAADPTDSASWVKTGPVFAPGNGVVGVGHHTFTTSPDGREDWLVYHAKVGPEPGWNRVIRMQKFGWRPDGAPDFGAPVANGAPVAVPSGECR